jgi:large subunit ribosomal protein L28
MPRECYFCAKKVAVGNSVARRGLAKAKGGVGRRVTGREKRTFQPNLQKVRARIDGRNMRIRVCTRCMKSGKVVKP